MARIRRESDPLGLVSFGVFLVVLALVIMNFPDVFSDVVVWLRSWEIGGPTMISMKLVWPLVWLLLGNGIWSLVLAAARLLTNYNRRKSVSDAFGGLFLLVASFLFREYASGLISLTVLLPSLVIALGVMIVLGSAVSYTLYRRL